MFVRVEFPKNGEVAQFPNKVNALNLDQAVGMLRVRWEMEGEKAIFYISEDSFFNSKIVDFFTDVEAFEACLKEKLGCSDSSKLASFAKIMGNALEAAQPEQIKDREMFIGISRAIDTIRGALMDVETQAEDNSEEEGE